MSDIDALRILKKSATTALESAQRWCNEDARFGKPTIVVAIAFPSGDFQYVWDGGFHAAAGLMEQCQKNLLGKGT